MRTRMILAAATFAAVSDNFSYHPIAPASWAWATR
jgi:hypothetical protein